MSADERDARDQEAAATLDSLDRDRKVARDKFLKEVLAPVGSEVLAATGAWPFRYSGFTWRFMTETP